MNLENWIVGICTGIISGAISGYVVYFHTKTMDNKKIQKLEAEKLDSAYFNYLRTLAMIIEQGAANPENLKSNMVVISQLPKSNYGGAGKNFSQIKKNTAGEIIRLKDEIIKVCKSSDDITIEELERFETEVRRLSLQWLTDEKQEVIYEKEST